MASHDGHRPLRIAQICGATDGAQWMVDISAGLVERGHEVVAIIGSAKGDTAARLGAAGVPYVVLAQNLSSRGRVAWAVARVPFVGRRLRYVVDGLALLSTCIRMARVLRRLRVDITHAHIFNSILIGRIAGAMARVPIRISMVPGPYHLEAPFTRRIDLATHRLDHRIVGGSKVIDDLYREHGVSSDRLQCIPYGADPSIFDRERADPGRIRRELALPDSAPLVGQIAHFYQVVHGALAPAAVRGRGIKGHEDFIAAARIVSEQRPDARFLLVGAGWGPLGEEHRRDIERLVRSVGLEHAVIFTGPRADVPDILAALDVSVQCSLSENYGGTLESLLMGAPTIATRVGAMPEAVRHEETGLLVPPRDPDALAAAMLRLIADRPLAERLGRRGRELVREQFTTERTVEAVDHLYRELAREQAPTGSPLHSTACG